MHAYISIILVMRPQDLKLENLLLSKEELPCGKIRTSAKLADFGLCIAPNCLQARDAVLRLQSEDISLVETLHDSSEHTLQQSALFASTQGNLKPTHQHQAHTVMGHKEIGPPRDVITSSQSTLINLEELCIKDDYTQNSSVVGVLKAELTKAFPAYPRVFLSLPWHMISPLALALRSSSRQLTMSTFSSCTLPDHHEVNDAYHDEATVKNLQWNVSESLQLQREASYIMDNSSVSNFPPCDNPSDHRLSDIQRIVQRTLHAKCELAYQLTGKIHGWGVVF